MWRTVSPDDVIFIPAGTIHAIGAGLVIAEIQQRSDATFRLFDYGRKRELHIENAIAVADAGPAKSSGHKSAGSPRNGRFSSATPTSCSNGSIWRQTPLGAWTRNARLGFSLSAAAPALDRSMLPQAMPFSRSRTASISVPARSAWWASWPTRAVIRLRTCCSASGSPGQSTQDGDRTCRCQLQSLAATAAPTQSAWKHQ